MRRTAGGPAPRPEHAVSVQRCRHGRAFGILHAVAFVSVASAANGAGQRWRQLRNIAVRDSADSVQQPHSPKPERDFLTGTKQYKLSTDTAIQWCSVNHCAKTTQTGKISSKTRKFSSTI